MGIRNSGTSTQNPVPGKTLEGAPKFADIASEPRPRTSVWRRFRRHRLALAGFLLLSLLTITSVVAPAFLMHGPNRINTSSVSQSPNSEHWLGSDQGGRDVLSRLVQSGRVSLSVGVLVVLISGAIGITLGALAGYFGGWIDSIVMRFTDVILSFPTILVVITVIALIGPGLLNLIFAMSLAAWPPMARLLRADFLSLRERDFILAARSVGVPGTRIVIRHLLPNAMAPIIVAATFGVATAILLEAGLSFLGLGVPIPTATWGNMLSQAQTLSVLESMWWQWIPPGLMITLTILAINFIGDGLRDALDPRSRSR